MYIFVDLLLLFKFYLKYTPNTEFATLQANISNFLLNAAVICYNQMFQVVSDENWLNLTCQSLQPSYTDFHQFGMKPVEDRSHRQCMEWYTDDAYTGGGCLKISGVLEEDAPCLTYK